MVFVIQLWSQTCCQKWDFYEKKHKNFIEPQDGWHTLTHAATNWRQYTKRNSMEHNHPKVDEWERDGNWNLQRFAKFRKPKKIPKYMKLKTSSWCSLPLHCLSSKSCAHTCTHLAQLSLCQTIIETTWYLLACECCLPLFFSLYLTVVNYNNNYYNWKWLNTAILYKKLLLLNFLFIVANNSSIILLNVIFFSLQIVLSLYRNGNISEAEHLFSRLYDENGPDEVFCITHSSPK